jgi:hypothetical protein
VTVAVPLLPSDVAVIVAGPFVSRPVTRPEPFTDARKVWLDDQVTARPVKTFPCASLSVAVSWTVPPEATVAVDGVTVTVATGAAVTVTVDDPNTGPTDALMLADPAACPLTSPLALTVAVAGAFVDQTKVTPGTVAFDASRAVAASWRVWPT